MPDSKLPTLFVPHGGGPCFFMDWTMGPPDTWDRMAAWLRQLASTLPSRPRAVLVISGHWEADAFTAGSNPRPPLIYDYYGFPEHTYQLKYDAPGSPELASRAVELLASSGLPARTDPERGYDHGVFVPFKLIFPNADVPVVQLSLRHGLRPDEHLAAGRALAPLREEGVLIVGSGMSYHNLRGFGPAAAEPSAQFDAWLTRAVTAPPGERDAALARWESAPAARTAHPREEHLLPLMVVAGAAADDVGQQIFTDRVMGAIVSAYRFG